VGHHRSKSSSSRWRREDLAEAGLVAGVDTGGTSSSSSQEKKKKETEEEAGGDGPEPAEG